MSFDALLTHECTIQRQTKTNVNGVLTPTWDDTFASGAPCLLQEGRGEIRAAESGKSLIYDAICFFGPAQDLRPRGQDDVADRVLMTSPATLAGMRFIILIAVDESGQGHHLTAYLRRLPSGS